MASSEVLSSDESGTTLSSLVMKEFRAACMMEPVMPNLMFASDQGKPSGVDWSKADAAMAKSGIRVMETAICE
jgi:hypothetical protein